MAITSTAIAEVQTGGSDTSNAGLFDINNSAMANDGAVTSANTSSPVISSASYSFVSGDVGAWVFFKGIGVWAKVTSVSGGNATLDAAIGHTVSTLFVLNTAAGISTSATLSGLVWSMDYSQGTSAISLTGLTTAAANAIILTTSATKAMVGNGVQITGGTNFTTGIYVIASVVAGTSITVDRNCTTAAGVAGTAGVGGAFASVGKVGGIIPGGNITFQKSGSYTLSVASDNVASGRWRPSGGSGLQYTRLIGYQSFRGDRTGTKPVVSVSAAYSGGYAIYTDSAACTVENIAVDGTGAAAGFVAFEGQIPSRDYYHVDCVASNCAIGFLNLARVFNCYANTCAIGFNSTSYADFCESRNHTSTGFNVQEANNSLSTTTTGSAKNFQGCSVIQNCTANGGSSGVYMDQNAGAQQITNTLISNCTNALDGNTGVGWTAFVYGLAVYNVTSKVQTGVAGRIATEIGTVICSVDPFVNAASNNFALNSTSGGGASLRGTGYPSKLPGNLTNNVIDIGSAKASTSSGGSTLIVIED